jgi:putative heme iron utilization protein
MADPLTPAISDRICQHMNEDHAEAVLLYARVFGGSPDAVSATLKSIDPAGMNAIATTDSGERELRIDFDRELTDSEDAHQMLIAMVRQARTSG